MRALVPLGLTALLAATLPVVTPAAAVPAPDACVATLDSPERGANAIESLGTDLPEAARVAGLGPKRLEQTLRNDRTMWIDACGFPFYVEPASTTEAAESTPESTTPDPLALHSRPGASRTLFLDFDGHTVSGTGWNANYTAGRDFTAEPYSKDTDPAFNTTELAVIEEVWRRVAEDYAPFDLDVTTEDPGQEAITRSGPTDLQYGTRVLITNTNTVYSSCSCGGIAYVGTFDSTSNHAYAQPALVFTRGAGTNSKGIAEAASHEAGHNLGLTHDGTSASNYYTGHGAWAPLMGIGYHRPVTQWSRGEYSGANNSQDDLSVMTNNGAIRMTDEVADTFTDARAIEPGTTTGLIETADDTDWFRFLAGGATQVKLTPASPSPNLDTSLTLYDSSQAVVATSDPAVTMLSKDLATGLDGSITLTLAPGEYRVKVDGTGYGTATTGYTDYGSLGRYELSLATGAVPVQITSGAPPQGQVGAAYSHRLSAGGGQSPYAWSLTSGSLPPGLSLQPGGLLSGTPTSAGTSTAVIAVTDALAGTATTTVSISVVPAPAPAPPSQAPAESPGPQPVQNSPVTLRITTSRLPAARVDKRYTARLNASLAGGRWRQVYGQLPKGIRLTRTGVLRGKPASPGRYGVVVSVGRDDLRTQKALVLRVRP